MTYKVEKTTLLVFILINLHEPAAGQRKATSGKELKFSSWLVPDATNDFEVIFTTVKCPTLFFQRARNENSTGKS